MKKIKMIISILISIVILFSSTIISNANTVDENRKAFDEFYEIVTKAFAAEGKELIIEYDENHTYTQQDIDAMLDFLEQNELIITRETSSSPKAKNKQIARLMPVYFEYSDRFVVSYGISNAVFDVEASGMVDLQGNNIMSVNPIQIIYRGGLNYQSHDLDVGYSKVDSLLVFTVTGYVMFSYTGAITGLNYSVNQEVTENFAFDTVEYI